MVFFLFFDEVVDAIKSASSVVADDSSSAISIRKSCDVAKVSYLSHFVRICLENSIVMSGYVVKHIVDFFWQLLSVFLYFFSYHLDSAKRTNTSFQRFVCLKSHDDVLAGHDISRPESVDSHDSAGVNFEGAACFSFRNQKFLHFFEAFFCSFGCSREETSVTVVRVVIQCDELFNVDVFGPVSGNKSFPFFSHYFWFLLVLYNVYIIDI